MKIPTESDPIVHAHEGPATFAEELEAIDIPDDMRAEVIALHERYLGRDSLQKASVVLMKIVDRVRDFGYLPALLCYELGIVTGQTPTEIAVRFGVSKQAVHQLHKRMASRLSFRGVHEEMKVEREPTAPVRPGRGYLNVREAAKFGRMPINEIKRLKADGIFTITKGLDGLSEWLMRDEVKRIARQWAIHQAHTSSSGWPSATGGARQPQSAHPTAQRKNVKIVNVKTVKDVKDVKTSGPSFLQSTK